ncbi:lactonase family protein [Streptomyces olivaceus]
MAHDHIAFVSSWTDGLHGAGGNGGVRCYGVDTIARTWTLTHTYDTLVNAGYLALTSDAASLYLLDERKDIIGGAGDGRILRYSVDRTSGTLSHQGSTSTIGPNPSYVSLDPSDSFVFTANHGSAYHAGVRITWDEETRTARQELVLDDGTVTVLPVTADGGLPPAAHVEILPAHPGPDPKHQRSAHPHAALPDPTGTFLIVCDKGSDRVHSYRIDRVTGRLRRVDTFRTRPGYAPRHPLFHPANGLLYTVNELHSSIDVFALGDDGTLSHRQNVSTVPFDDPGDNHPSDLALHPSGAYLFASNRGHDSICALTVDPASGLLEPVQTVPVGGSRPRGITVDPEGRTLYAACTDSGLVTATDIDPDTGKLTPTSTALPVPRPTCIRFLPSPSPVSGPPPS